MAEDTLGVSSDWDEKCWFTGALRLQQLSHQIAKGKINLRALGKTEFNPVYT